MAGKQAPPSAVFHECIRELEQRIERFATGDSFCVRFASDDCGVAMNARLHVVILELSYFGSFFFAWAISSERVVTLPVELVNV